MSRYFNEDLTEDIFLSDDELAHFGVLGMKWGVRRYQNKDGSLTAAGKRKYKISPDGNLKKRSKEELSKYDKQVSNLKKAKEAKKRKEAIRKKGLEGDLDTIAKNSNMFTTDEINNATNKARALASLNDQRRVNASNAKKWVDTAVSYGQTLKNAYSLISSNEVQGFIMEYNSRTGSNIPLMPNSYDNYNKIHGKTSQEDKKK